MECLSTGERNTIVRNSPVKTSFVADPVILCPRLCVPASVSCGFPPLSLYEHVRIEQGTDRPEGLGRGVKPAPSSEEEGVPPSRLHATALWTVAAAAPSLLTRHIPPPPPPSPSASQESPANTPSADRGGRVAGNHGDRTQTEKSICSCSRESRKHPH